ncbi:MAG TPA: TatD family deoxyribonuclease [Candidatus Woesearchaeota archaeon]|nr:TatD family deoxyribonuclease [Candidatus Woesearchaeota archaeon]
MSQYVDVHAHMTEKIFDNDRDEIIKKCKEKGITIITCGTSRANNREVLKLIQDHPHIKACLGFYPVDLLKVSDKEFFDELKFIEENKDKIVGIGEVGVDFYWIKDDNERKKEVERFQEIIWVANRLKLPLNVHTRDATRECIAMLVKSAHVPVNLHAFSGEPEEVEMAVENGFFFSITSNIVYNKRRQNLVKILPIENILTETDCPYLGPNPKEKNSPLNIPLAVEKIAELKEMPVEKAKKMIWENAKRIFKI